MAKYVTISVIVLIPAMTKHYFTHEDTHELFIKTGPVPTCGAVLNVHFDQMFVTGSRKDDILKPQQKMPENPFFSVLQFMSTWLIGKINVMKQRMFSLQFCQV